MCCTIGGQAPFQAWETSFCLVYCASSWATLLYSLFTCLILQLLKEESKLRIPWNTWPRLPFFSVAVILWTAIKAPNSTMIWGNFCYLARSKPHSIASALTSTTDYFSLKIFAASNWNCTNCISYNHSHIWIPFIFRHCTINIDLENPRRWRCPLLFCQRQLLRACKGGTLEFLYISCTTPRYPEPFGPWTLT